MRVATALQKLPRFFFFQAEDGIRDPLVTGVQTCALPIWPRWFAVGVAATLAAATEPIRETLGYGQINVLLVGLIMSDLVALRWRERASALPGALDSETTARSEERRVGKEGGSRGSPAR